MRSPFYWSLARSLMGSLGISSCSACAHRTNNAAIWKPEGLFELGAGCPIARTVTCQYSVMKLRLLVHVLVREMPMCGSAYCHDDFCLHFVTSFQR